MNVFLNGHSSRSICINAGFPLSCIFGLTLFLIFIDDLLDVISFQLDNYAYELS